MKTPAALLVSLTLLSGCSGMQSALHTAGPSASKLKELIVLIVGISVVVWILVVCVLVWALLRHGKKATAEDPRNQRRLSIVVAVAVAATTFIVAGLTVASFWTTRALDVNDDTAVTIRVRAQQWWWQFVYEAKGSDPSFQTANEMHIPVGRTIRVMLESADVIHSFWVPSLAGKMDLVPGRENMLTFRADRPGVYRGQCAEFCGLQHSHMAFMVIAEEEADYRRWTERQKDGALPPDSAEARAGMAVFMGRQCAACHTIRGTPAAGLNGPDLTHVGSRQTIGAGLLATTRGSFAAWIADPQTLKPGNNMPLVPLTGEELRQVSAYMEGLK